MSQDKKLSKYLRLLVSIALFIWLAWRTDWIPVGLAFRHLRPELWLGAVGLFLLAQIASAVRWRLLAQPLGFHLPLRDFINFYFVGMFFNLLLPTAVGGDVVRAWYLDGGSGRRLAAFLSVFVDRFSGLLVLLGLACVADMFCPIALPFWVGTSVWATAGCAVVGLVSLPAANRYLAYRGNRNPADCERGCVSAPRSVESGRVTLAQRLCARTLSLSHSLTLFLGRPRLLLTTTFLSLLVQGINVVLVWLIGRAIGAPVPASYYGIVVPMVTLLTLLPISVNGMGVREGGMVLFLAPLGIPSSTALSLALLWFSVFVAASLFGAGIYLFGNFCRPGEQAHDPSLGRDSDQGRTRQPKAAA
jgi:uncharacterized protein (TIRG00374 family)